MSRPNLEKIRFMGRHRCPRCRMPLYAEEIACPVCELQIVFVNEQGEVMIEMIAVDDPSDWTGEDVNEYLAMLEVEARGDMYLTRRYLPTRPQRAHLVQLQDGILGVRFSNRVTLDDVRKQSGQKAVKRIKDYKLQIQRPKVKDQKSK